MAAKGQKPGLPRPNPPLAPSFALARQGRANRIVAAPDGNHRRRFPIRGRARAAEADGVDARRVRRGDGCLFQRAGRQRDGGTALIPARASGNSPDFRLDARQRNDLREAMKTPRERE